jgi:hypothetical protein
MLPENGLMRAREQDLRPGQGVGRWDSVRCDGLVRDGTINDDNEWQERQQGWWQ